MLQQGKNVNLPIGPESDEVHSPFNSSDLIHTIDIHIDVEPYDKKADRPECICQVECDEACLNRAMFYECDDECCALDNRQDCSNRTFQEAAIRYADHNSRSCGFEVFNVLTSINLKLTCFRRGIEGSDCVHCEIFCPIRLS